MRILIIFFIFLLVISHMDKQKSVFSENLYFLLDEANDHLIEYKSVIKPLNKLQIIDLLEKANQSNYITKRKRKK